MMNNKVTILLSTCDKYADAWGPFFSLWKKYWPECDYPFIINSEKKSFSSPDFSVTSIPGGEGRPWSKRLKKCLQHVQTEYVLLTLEDYFLQAPVNTEIFQAALQTMEETPDLGVIQFAIDIVTFYDETERINTYFAPVPGNKKEKKSGRIYCVLSLYRTRYLKKLLLPLESPWEFESFGSVRSHYYKEKVYRETEDHPRCFQYFIEPIYGYAISRGKWLPKNRELFNENHIDVNFENLGIMEEEEYQTYVDMWTKKIKPQKPHHTLLQKITLPFTHPTEFIRITRTLIKRRFPFFP